MIKDFNLFKYGVLALVASVGLDAHSGFLCQSVFHVGRTKLQSPMQARDYRIPGINPSAEYLPDKTLKQMILWAQQRARNGFVRFDKPSSPHPGDLSIYNWGDSSQNIGVVTKGIRLSSSLFERRTDPAHIGIYGMTDPASAAHFGNILIEIVIDGHQGRKASGHSPFRFAPWQISKDPSAGGGDGDKMVIRNPEFKTESIVVQDLRIIKEIRFPRKEEILGAWENTNFITDIDSLRRLAEQWLLTPNYKPAERYEIARYSPKQFASYLRQIDREKFDIEPRTAKGSLSTNALRMNGILEVLTGKSAEGVVALDTLSINYLQLFKTVSELTNEQKNFIELMTNAMPLSRLKLALSLVLATDRGDQEKATKIKQNLIVSIKQRDKHFKEFSSYDSKVAADEIKLIELL